MTQNSHHQHRPLMVQAPVRALDPDGVAVVTAGTVGFAVGALICWLVMPQLIASGKGWYLGVALTGTLLGLLGLGVGVFRKVRRRRATITDPDELPPSPAAPRRGAEEDRATTS